MSSVLKRLLWLTFYAGLGREAMCQPMEYPGGPIRPGVLALKGKWICSFLPEVVKRYVRSCPSTLSRTA